VDAFDNGRIISSIGNCHTVKMALKLTEVEKAVSPAGAGYWVQVHDFMPEDAQERVKRGRLVAILGVSNSEEGETMKLVELGREVLSFFHEQYYGDLEGGVLEKLKQSLVKITEEFGNRVEVATLVDVNEVLYVGFCGGAKICAWADGNFGFVGGEDSIAVRVFSYWKKKDTKLILGTANFWEKFGEGRIRALLESDKNCREIAEELAVVIGSVEEGSGMGGVILKIGESSDDEIAEIEAEREELPKTSLEVNSKWKAGLTNFWGQTRTGIFSHREKMAWMRKINWGIVLVIVLGILIVGGGFWRQYQTNNGTRVAEKIAEVEQKLKEASILADTNSERAKEILESVKPDLRELAKLKNEKITKLLEEARIIEETASGLVRLEFKEAADLALLREGLVINKIKKAGNKLMLLDSAGGRVVSYDTEKDNGEVVLGGEILSGTRMLAYYPGYVYVAGNLGVKECVMDNWKCSQKIEGTELPAGMTDIAIWAGNLYVLDGQLGKIWKYPKQSTGFGKKVSWMEGDKNLLGSENIQIDGRIWVGFLEGGIGKYNAGVKENFEISNLSAPSLGKNIMVYTSEDETKLYVLDPTNKRIVVIEKNGSFVKQFVAEVIGSATGIAVYEDKARIYLSVGSKMYRAEIP